MNIDLLDIISNKRSIFSNLPTINFYVILIYRVKSTISDKNE